ncbi:carbon-nitrogen hydrolase family protein [Candidatus Micrarchaeota archaeon]|nr:carbon-nitrogen hydrolase family protein [Candidatus Micrarchaeota archaeon]
MKVGLVQMEITHGNLQSNLIKIQEFIKEGKKKKLDIIVFPEDALTGIVREFPDLVDSEGKYRSIFSRLAKENSIDILCGSFVERVDSKLYNTSCYFDSNGKILGEYRKINLWHSEREYIHKGKKIVVFDTRFGKAALAICWDLSNSYLFRKIAQKEVKLVFVPSFWSDGGTLSSVSAEARNIDSFCHVRALECEAAIIYVNAAGTYRNETLAGRSQVALPTKEAIKITHNKEALLVADIDLSILAHAASVYKIKSDLLSGYHEIKA